MMVIRDLAIQTEWIECKKGECEWYKILSVPEASDKVNTINLRMSEDVIFCLFQKYAGFIEQTILLEQEKFPGGISMGIRSSARQNRPDVRVSVPTRPFLNIDTTQCELDIALNGWPLPPAGSIGGIGGIGVPDNLPTRTRGSGMSVAQQFSDLQIIEHMTVTAVNAQNLPIVDRDGGCDSYVEITVNGDLKWCSTTNRSSERYVGTIK